MLDAPYSERWCAFVSSIATSRGTMALTTFKPVPGNAIFWQNLNEDRSGNSALLHSGLPVTKSLEAGDEYLDTGRAVGQDA
ncbi:hypothetical protein LZ554_007277 [Drepanopeziza brunnea f. sp. 'monogermtubi']|nr:hypothetical protein LZ554_007277 [Drepanopeziza brunnea f. sp. 'monogermtubi']